MIDDTDGIDAIDFPVSCTSVEAPIGNTQMDEPRVPSFEAVISVNGQLLEWLRDEALPFWDQNGVDRHSEGFLEEICPVNPPAVRPEVRRGRVVARQIFAFDVGRLIGWRSSSSNPIDHGCDFLFLRLHAGDGIFHTAVDSVTHRPQASFSLYEQAFYLFALARLTATSAERHPVVKTALNCLHRLRINFGRAMGGFDESTPPSLPLKSNPHMHLLEAALEWLAVTEGAAQLPWANLASEIVGLCLTCFIDPVSGAIREYYNADWRPMADDSGRIVEPGHQFEWAWLLMQWSALGYGSLAEQSRCVEAAASLIDIGERWGVNSERGIAINELWEDMSVKDPAAKLWPQTERLKAWCAVLIRAQCAAQAEYACRMILSAARGLMKYFRCDAPGLWHEVCSEEGDFPHGPSKASSLYHVACAIHVLANTVATTSSRAATAGCVPRLTAGEMK